MSGDSIIELLPGSAMLLVPVLGFVIARAVSTRVLSRSDSLAMHAVFGRVLGLGLTIGVVLPAIVVAFQRVESPEGGLTPTEWLTDPTIAALAAVLLLFNLLDFEVDRFWVGLSAIVAAGTTWFGLSEFVGRSIEHQALFSVLAAGVTILLFLSSRHARLASFVRRTAIEQAGDHLLLVGRDDRVLYGSEYARDAMGLEPRSRLRLGQRDVLPNALVQLVRDEHRDRARMRTPAGHILEARVVDLAGRARMRGFRAILVRDVTGEHQDERRLVRLAHYDSLTGLANRRLFLETLKKTLEVNAGEGGCGALFYLDLDHFKAINDSLGHAAGDDLLRSLSDRLRSALRPEELVNLGVPRDARLMVARLAGDEFAVIAPSLPNREAGGEIARRMIDVIRQPLELTDRTLNPSASIGIAVFPDDASEVEPLLHRADSALYVAKSRGRRRFAWYEATFDEKVDRARLLEEGLRYALGRNEMRLLYQPKIDARSGELVGFEALLRWRSQDLGDVGPSEFIPVAEDRGLVTELGSWCIDEACRQLRAWSDAGLAVVPVSVNVSSAQLTASDLQRVVSGALKHHDVAPSHLELELTESMLLDDRTHVEQILRDLRSIGVTIALDDFGTGYSALSYLNRFNLDVLKMDRSLLRDIDSNPSAHGIASAVVAMAHSLGLSVVAEGVDTEDQIPLLREMDCDQIQGFIYAPALPHDEVMRFMVKRDEGALSFGPGMSVVGGKKVEVPARLEREKVDEELLALSAPNPSGRGLTLEHRALVIDDEASSLEFLADRVGLLGVDVQRAPTIDAAQLIVYDEPESIRLILTSPAIDLGKVRDLREQISGVNDDAPRWVVIGEAPYEDARREMRELGVDWVLFSPFNDTELRYVVRSATAQREELAHRREIRMPVDLVANIWCGDRREMAVVSSLSPRGAFIEVAEPIEVGSSLRIEMDLKGDLYRGFGRVVYVHAESNASLDEPTGVGVTFYGAGREEERLLRKSIGELEFRFRP